MIEFPSAQFEQSSESLAEADEPQTSDANGVKHFRIKWGPDEWQTAIKSAHVDVEKFICLLCERQFDASEKLEKHVRVSQLHKDNFAKEKTRIIASMRYVMRVGRVCGVRG